ncbi:MAG: signal peptidase I [Gammaproteobacteria bacterium]|nr:signal peptidase I [Gammaproteobacteria bacterium]
MDFSLILFLFLVVSGLIILVYRQFFEKRRNASLGSQSGRSQPVIVEYARALFPVVLVVFLLRSFIVEPFRIPSGSMLSTLHIGDFILVNKFKYGIRLPIINTKVFPIDSPARGDVMVFKYPKDPKLNFIKRVIGLPGDTLKYENKELYINGEKVATEADGEYVFEQKNMGGQTARQLIETIDDSSHHILVNDNVTRSLNMEVSVPQGHYFVMGDNRDHSNDSRYWRFVPEDHVVGQAFFIWFSWKSLSGGGVDWGRIGTSIQ